MSSSKVLHNDGLQFIVDVLRGAVPVPANLYLGLRTCDGVGGHPVDAQASDTLSSNLAEVPVANTNYNRIAIPFTAANFTRTQSGNIVLLQGVLETFTFNGSGANVNGITHYFLATSADASGHLISSAPMNNTYNVSAGASIGVTPSISFATGAP